MTALILSYTSLLIHNFGILFTNVLRPCLYLWCDAVRKCNAHGDFVGFFFVGYRLNCCHHANVHNCLWKRNLIAPRWKQIFQWIVQSILRYVTIATVWTSATDQKCRHVPSGRIRLRYLYRIEIAPVFIMLTAPCLAHKTAVILWSHFRYLFQIFAVIMLHIETVSLIRVGRAGDDERLVRCDTS